MDPYQMYQSALGVPGSTAVPTAPAGTFTNRATQLTAPTTSTTGGPVMGGASSFISNFNNTHPLMSLSPDMFNAANQNNSETAFQMIQQGGPQFMQAVMAANGWNQNQMNNWLNQVGYENGKTFTPQAGSAQAFSQFGSQTMTPTTLGSLASGNAQPGAGGAQPGVASAPNGPQSFDSGIAPIAGTQPNYPLDIGAYLNPMMKYALQQGTDTINNSAAAAGNLNSGNTMKELMNFGMGQGANNFNNAAQIAAGQQAFGYGVDNNDRNFAYNAMNNDRNFNLQNLMGQAQLGLGAIGQQGTNDRTLATLLSQLGLSGANAASTGTIGAGNAITQAIQQALAGTIGQGVRPPGS